MKKFFLVFALLPFFVLADDWVVSKVFRYGATDTSASSPSGTFNFSYSNDSVSVQLAYSQQIHAVPYSLVYDNLQYGNLAPSSTFGYSRPFFSVSDGLYIPITRAPVLVFFDLLAARLVNSGFALSESNNFQVNLSSVQTVATNSNVVLYNLRSFSVVNAALVSTNTLWRGSVLNALASLDDSLKASVANSLTAVDSLGSLLSSYLAANRFSIGLSTNFLAFANDYYWGSQLSVHDVSSQIYDNILSVGQLDSPAASIDYFNAIRGGYSSLLQDSYKAYFQTMLENPSSVDSSTLQDLINHPSQAQSILASSYSTPTTNAVMQGAKKISEDVRESLSNNTQQIKKQLADWHNFASNGVKEVNGNLSTIAGNTSSSALKSAIESANIHIGDSVQVVLDGPVTIDSDQFNSVSVPLGSLKDTADNWYSQWADFYFSSSPERGWVKFFDLVSDFKEVNHSDLVSLEFCVSNLLVSFSSYTNGLPFVISNAIAGLSFSSTNSYLLLSDYADYIHSGGLDVLLDVMDDDSYSDLKAEVGSLYHADTAEGYGRWWRYFTGLSTVQANSIFKLSNIFQAHEKLLKDLKRDNSDLDVQDASDSSVFRKLLYTIPSDEDTFNKLSQLTNSIDQSGMVRVQQLIPDLTNRFSVAASLYDKDFVLPSEISWTLIPGDPSINSPARVVTICPSQHYRLFQMLHFGLAFSYCLVNIILFPKFLLFLVRLFDRVWNKSEKLIYNSTQS